MKKLALLFTIVFTGQLYGMEKEIPETKELAPKENLYKQLPKELQQEIINAAVTSSTNLSEAINAIENLGVWHNVLLNKDIRIHALTKMFPDNVKDVIVFAIEKPDIYQELDSILKENKSLDTTIDILKKNNLLQDNLKDFTILVHILADKFDNKMDKITNDFNTPIAHKYHCCIHHLMEAMGEEYFWRISVGTITAIIERGADINYIAFYGETPLEIAVRKNKYDVAKLLLDAGANPNFKNSMNVTPSQYMEAVGASQEIKKLIEDAIRHG